MAAGRKRMVSEKVYAELSGFELGKIRNDRWKKKGLPYYKIGRTVRYDEDEIYAYLQRCRVETRQGGGAR
jgi:hypothetical protein